MKYSLLIAALFVCAVYAKENVVTLTTKNFDSFVNKEDFIVVEFYAPWCGHCKNLAPEYEKAAGELLKNDPPIILAKVDATEEGELGQRFDVRGYPTIKIFRNGEPSEYEGPRDAAGIVSYVKKQAGPASKPLETEEAAKKFLSNAQDVVILGLFDSKDSAGYQTFTKTANQLRDSFSFAESSVASLAAEYGVENGVALILPSFLQSKSEKMVVTTTDLSSTASLKSWINKNSLPLVGPLTDDNSERYQGAKKAVLTVWANIDFKLDAKGSNYIANRVRKVAAQFPDILFTVGDIRSQFGGKVLSTHGLNSKDLYAVTVKSKEGQKYLFKGLTGQEKGFKADGLEEFVNDFVNGKVSPYIKSEEAPEQATVKGVTTLVGKNFHNEVTDGTPALIEFYAPWCGHCKNLAPTWDKLGAALENENVVIAKMDATANDVPPGFEVQGFPTIYYKPASGAPEKYQGGRDLKDFVKFLKGKKALSSGFKEEL